MVQEATKLQIKTTGHRPRRALGERPPSRQAFLYGRAWYDCRARERVAVLPPVRRARSGGAVRRCAHRRRIQRPRVEPHGAADGGRELRGNEGADWKAEGVAVRGRTGDPTCIYFDDPDGHTLQLLYKGHDG